MMRRSCVPWELLGLTLTLEFATLRELLSELWATLTVCKQDVQMDDYSGYRTVPWTGVLATLADPTSSLRPISLPQIPESFRLFSVSELTRTTRRTRTSSINEGPNTKGHRAGGRTGRISGGSPWLWTLEGCSVVR